RGRRRDAGNLDVDRAQVASAGEKQRPQGITSKADVGGCRLTMDDATELLSLRIENIDSSRAAAIHVSGRPYKAGPRGHCACAPSRWGALARRRNAHPTLRLRSRLLCDRHRNAGDFQVDRTEMHAAREEQSLPVAAAEPDVCGRRLAMDD